jgi:hypothetical protein
MAYLSDPRGCGIALLSGKASRLAFGVTGAEFHLVVEGVFVNDVKGWWCRANGNEDGFAKCLGTRRRYMLAIKSFLGNKIPENNKIAECIML